MDNNNRLYSARTGTMKNGITEKEAISIAQENLIEGLKLDHVEYLTETNSHTNTEDSHYQHMQYIISIKTY